MSSFDFVRIFVGMDPAQVYKRIESWLENNEFYKLTGQMFPNLIEITHGSRKLTRLDFDRDSKKKIRFEIGKVGSGTEVKVRIRFSRKKSEESSSNPDVYKMLIVLLEEAWSEVDGKSPGMSQEARIQKERRIAIKKRTETKNAKIGLFSMVVGSLGVVMTMILYTRLGTMGSILALFFTFVLLLGGKTYGEARHIKYSG
jgi:hypothetical protein